MENLPSPNEYLDWKSWAASLISILSSQETVSYLNIPIYFLDETKNRQGLPIAAVGDLIWIVEGEVRKLAVYDGKNWIKYSPDA